MEQPSSTHVAAWLRGSARLEEAMTPKASQIVSVSTLESAEASANQSSRDSGDCEVRDDRVLGPRSATSTSEHSDGTVKTDGEETAIRTAPGNRAANGTTRRAAAGHP